MTRTHRTTAAIWCQSVMRCVVSLVPFLIAVTALGDMAADQRKSGLEITPGPARAATIEIKCDSTTLELHRIDLIATDLEAVVLSIHAVDERGLHELGSLTADMAPGKSLTGTLYLAMASQEDKEGRTNEYVNAFGIVTEQSSARVELKPLSVPKNGRIRSASARAEGITLGRGEEEILWLFLWRPGDKGSDPQRADEIVKKAELPFSWNKNDVIESGKKLKGHSIIFCTIAVK